MEHSSHSQLVKTSYGEEYETPFRQQDPPSDGTYTVYFESPMEQGYQGLSLKQVMTHIETTIHYTPGSVTKVTIYPEQNDVDANNPPSGGAGAYPEELEGQPPSMTDAYAPALEQEQAQRTV